MNPRGFISSSARIFNEDFKFGPNVFIGDRVTIFRNEAGGEVFLEGHVGLSDEVVIETGYGGSVRIGEKSRCQVRCHLSAYKSDILIGKNVGIGPGCRFISHNHGRSEESHNELLTKGPIILEDGVWVGADVKVLSGVRIGQGAVIAAGSVVTHDIPPGAIAAGVPARVVKRRSEMAGNI
jgi:acetyltransferase-like isoleucine patch superfamily enzyme